MVEIVFESDNKRAAAYDEGQFVGESTFSASQNLWIIDHTLVEEEYGGQEIATRLVEKIVQEARAQGIKIIPLCPFAKREFDHKEEYRDVLAR